MGVAYQLPLVLSADTPQDYELKFGLLDDVYSVIDVESKLGGALEECIGGYCCSELVLTDAFSERF